VVQRPAAVAPPAMTTPADGWSQFRGPGGMGVSLEKEAPLTWSATEGVAWKTALPGPGTSSPIVHGTRVYLTCYSGSSDQPVRHLVCLDRGTGKILWDTKTAATGPEESSIREDHGWASSTPATDGARIYAFFGRSGVYAFDMNGRQLWRAAVGDRAHGWGSAASLLLYGDRVIVNASVESDSLVALDRRTGKQIWRAGGIKEAWNTPVLVSVPGGKTELVLAMFRKVLGFDPESGNQLWSCDTRIDWYMVPSLVARDGIVYGIGGRGGGALAVRAGGRGDVTATHVLWYGQRGSNVSSPVLHEGHLYWAKDSPAAAYCADAKTGRVLYEERLDRAGQVYGSPVLVNGRLYYVARNGRTFVIRAVPRFEVLAVNDLGERGVFNASPAVAGGRLFIRSDRFLYCIGD
jgi:outer membrane protein assembly factor BamB